MQGSHCRAGSPNNLKSLANFTEGVMFLQLSRRRARAPAVLNFFDPPAPGYRWPPGASSGMRFEVKSSYHVAVTKRGRCRALIKRSNCRSSAPLDTRR